MLMFVSGGLVNFGTQGEIDFGSTSGGLVNFGTVDVTA